MGLTESNHSKATTGCTGPSKSRSTPHFPDSRGYHGRPRQAATLPARPTPDSSQTPPYHQSRIPVHDPHALGHDPRPPEREPSYRDSYVQVGRSPSFRPGVPRRSASADSRKRRSDPLLDAKTLKQIPGMVAFHHGPHQVSLPQPTGSPPTSPRSSAQRPRPTAIYVADDEPTHVVRMREGRSRDRESMGRQSRDRESLGRQSRDRESMGRQSRDRESMGRHSRNGQRTESRERSRGSRDRKQRTTHVSTFTMTPHCPDSTHTAPGNGAQPSSYQKHRKTRHKSGQRAEYTVPDNPQSDPYVCLHYGGTMKNGQKKPVQQVTAWRTDYSEEAPSSPNHQMSQVVIHMNQVTATTLDNYDAVNANIESVQVRRNVWFQASRAVGSVNEPPIRRKISSKAIRTPSIYETTSGYQNSDIIRYPDVTNKVSSIYMRPDLLHNKESDTIYSSTASSSIGQRRDLISSEPSSHRYPYNHSHRGNAVASMYEVSYSKEPNSEEKIFHDPPLQLDVTDEIGLGGCYRSHEKCELENPSATDFNGRRDIEVSGLNYGLPSLELPGPSYKQPSTNGDLNYGTMIDEEENTRYSHRNVKGMELNFGINNHIEDYTIIEDATNHGPFYGCRDSDYENDDSCSTASRNFLSGLEPRSSQCNQDMPAECSFTLDKECLSSDKADKEPSTGDINQVVDYSQFALSDSTERRALKEKALSCDSPLNKTENRKELDDFYKKQYSLVADYLSLKDNVPLLKSEDKKSDLNGSISDHPGRSCSSDTVPLLLDSDLNGSFSDHPGRSYNSDTVPGSPSASAFSQKCLTQSSSLPRHLRCVSRSATLDSGNTDMKAFRNRFRSFDLGHFPVLRLPLGNQPRLVDVLRASSTHLEEKENNEELEGRASEESLDNTCDIAESVDVASNDVENPSVSYPECLETQEKEEEEEEENDDDGEVHVGSDAVSCVPCDSSENPSQNSPDIDEIRPESSPVAEQLPNELPDSQEEEKEEHHTDEGCDIGTIKKGALLRNLADTNSSPELFLPLNKASQGSLRQGMVGGPPVAVGVSSNTWHSNGSHVGSTRKWSNDGMQDGSGHRHPHRHVLLDGSVTLRHPNLKANESRKDVVDKRRALSDASSLLHLKPKAGDAPPTGEVPDIIPPFNKQVRRKHPNRRSIHSIDWDTPLPPVPQNDQKDCSYTCHEQCQDLVTLDCKADLTPDSHTSEEDLYVDSDSGTLVKHELLPCLQTPSVTVTSQDEDEEELEVEEEVEEEDEDQEEQEEKHEEEQQEKDLLEEPRKNEEISTLRRKINRLQSHLVDNETLEDWVEKYNATTQGVKIAKENDGSYRGCIRVHLNLCRPINIVAGTRPPSIYDILQEDRTMEKTLTSFYMPRDAVKAIHITNKTTTREVIIALLRKFKVVDNPQKFALYERTHDTGQPGKAKLRRLGDSECPLVLAINWSAEGLTNKRLVLQENDTADIQWEAFSLPELSNFLRILDREEEEYRCQIKDKYALLRRRVGNILLQNAPAE